MPSFKEVWKQFGLILELDFFSFLCCSSEAGKPVEKETEGREFVGFQEG